MSDVFPQFAPFNMPTFLDLDRRRTSNRSGSMSLSARLHGTTQKVIRGSACAKAPATKVVDLLGGLPALSDPAAYARWYGHEHFAGGGNCRRRRSTGSPRSIARDVARSASCRQSRLLHDLLRTAADPAAPRPSNQCRRDCHRRQIRHDRRQAAKEEMLFSEVSEGFHAYGVGHHRHMAELDQEFSQGSRAARWW